MRKKAEEIDEGEEEPYKLIEFAPTPIKCHIFRDHNVFYGILVSGEIKFFKETNINNEFIHNYWKNLEIIESKDHLPAGDGEIVSLLKDRATNRNLQFIVKTDDIDIPYKILNIHLAHNFLGAKAIDFLEKNYRTK